MTSSYVWCLLIDRDKNISGSSFIVDITPTDTIDHLKNKVRQRNINDLASIDAKYLTVWRCTTESIEEHKGEREPDEVDEDIEFSYDNKRYIIEEVPVRTRVASLGLGDDDTLIVQMPGIVFEY
jgi:hypothetical protein